MHTRKLYVVIAAAMLVASRGSATIAEQDRPGPPGNDSAAGRATVKDLCLFTAEALDKSERAMETIDRIIAEKSVPLEVALASAQAAFLLNSPSKAIAIMERAVREHPDEKMPGVQFPVVVVGNLWIGTFARHAGDVSRADAAYRDVLSTLKGKPDIKGASVLAAICYLYLSEIESHFRARPDNARALIERLGALPHPQDQQEDAILRVYIRWGEHLLAKVGKNDRGANATPRPVQLPYDDWTYVPDLHSVLVGLGDPAELQRRRRTPSGISFFRCSMKAVLESRASSIDATIAQAALGREHERQKDFATAREYYRQLFSGGGFFAPWGGVALARCWKNDGKLGEAKTTLEEVARRFPEFKEPADELLKNLLDKSKVR